MATYKKDEIFTATEMVRNFSNILTRVCSGETAKAVIVKNNNLEAVLLKIEEYERLVEAVEILESIYSKRQKVNDGN